MYFLYKLIDPILKNQKPIIEIISNYESQDKAAHEEIRLIKELRELNKKSRKGFLFQKLIHEPFI